MRIDRAKLKKSLSDPPADCALLIQKLCVQSNDELRETLSNISTWTVGKCELYHWVSVLDRFDSILEQACTTKEGNKWQYFVDYNENLKELVLGILNFTALLIEYSCSRHIYGSIDHVITLLCVADLDVTLSVLNLLYVFSKRSTFLTRLTNEKRSTLYSRLEGLAESWGGKDNGFGLAECCDKNFAVSQRSATTLHFEFRVEDNTTNKIESIYVDNISKFDEPVGKIMESLLEMYPKLPLDKHMALYTRLRLAHSFGSSSDRLKCVQVRLHAISVLVFLSSAEGSMSSVLYPGFVEEIVDLLKLNNNEVTKLIEIKAAALRTLTSIVHFDCPPRLNIIIEATGSSEYHGFLPTLIRNCIQAMTSQVNVQAHDLSHFPHSLSTALFSFLYHLSSYDNGAEALVNSGMIESLLKVIRLIGDQQDQIMFVTRAVRIVDLVTNVDMQSFQSLKGIQIFVDRLEHEVDACRKDAPHELVATKIKSEEKMETDDVEQNNIPVFPKGFQCMPQRSALLKSILNFLKKTITDQAMADSVRHIMETSLPKSLRHIISNCEYYGPSLFLLAMEVIQIYVFQEPSLLSNMQETGLTDIILQALLVKEPPSTKEVLANMPNIFTALCLNEAGLNEFKKYNPFDKMFRVLICQEYLQAMKRRRSSDSVADTPAVLGSSVDELMRHQNSLRLPAIQAIIKLLKELVDIGNNPETVCMKVGSLPDSKNVNANEQNSRSLSRTVRDIEARSTASMRVPEFGVSVVQEVESQSDDDTEETMDEMNEEDFQQGNKDDEDEVMVENEIEKDISIDENDVKGTKRNEVPLMDYLVNVCKFLESMLSNNNTADHCKAFIKEGGLPILIQLVSLRALPVEFPSSAAASQIASVLRIILVLSKETYVLEATLKEVLLWLEYFENQVKLAPELTISSPSLLLRELLVTHNQNREPNSMPVMLSLSNIHSFVWLFHQMCNNSMQEVRNICVKVLGDELGLKVISKMADLCRFLIWENTILTSLVERSSTAKPNEPILGLGSDDFGKLHVYGEKNINSSPGTGHLETEVQSMDLGSPAEQVHSRQDEKSLAARQKLVKMLPQMIAADLGSKLSNLFSLLVKMSVGASHRSRPSGFNRNQTSSQVPSEHARTIATELASHAVKMLKWEPPIASEPIATTFPGLRFSFFICGIQMCSQLIMDDTKAPFHLMLQHLLAKDGINALELILYEGTKAATGISLDDILAKDELPEGCAEFIAEWLCLIEKMVDTSRVMESRYSLPTKYEPEQCHVPFRPGRYLACIHHLAFKAVNCMWGKSCLKGYSPKVNAPKLLESLLAVLRHVIKSEEFVRKQNEKENKEDEDHPKRLADATDRASKRFRTSLLCNRTPSVSTADASVEQLHSLITELTSQTYRTEERDQEDSDLTIRRLVTASLNSVSQNAVNNEGTASAAETPAPTGAVPTAPAEVVEISFAANVPADVQHRRCSTPANAIAPETETLRDNSFVESLIGMGYSERLSRRAVEVFPNSNDQAVEFCLANQDQDELEMAIQMSLQDNQTEETSTEPVAVEETAEKEEAKKTEKEEQQAKEMEEKKRKEIQHNKMVKLEQLIKHPIAKSAITKFTNDMIPGCLQLLDDDPDTVYRISDLLIVTIRRNGSEWMNKMLKEIVQNINQVAHEVFKECSNYLPAKKTYDEPKRAVWIPSSLMDSLHAAGFHLNTVNNSRRLSTGLLLLTLLFEEAKMDCVEGIDNANLMKAILELLSISKTLIDIKLLKSPIPKWISSALLLTDLYQKTTISDMRRKMLEKETEEKKMVWMWFDSTQAKWSLYNENDQETISNAYMNGDSIVKLSTSRRKYTVYLSKMIQINDESHNRRPIMKKFVVHDKKKDSNVEKDDIPVFEADKFKNFNTLNDEEAKHLISCCISLINIESIDCDTLHSCLRIILRLTRNHSMALWFAESEGLESLFNLREAQGFNGFYSLVSLMIRHILESPDILQMTVEKTIRHIGNIGAAHHLSGINQNSQGRHEFNYIVRCLGPVACRNPVMFVDAVKNSLKFVLRPTRDDKLAEQEERAIMEEKMALLVTTQKEISSKKDNQLLPQIESVIVKLVNKLFDQKSDETMDTDDKKKENAKNEPLITHNILLRIMGEIVTSYPQCAFSLTSYVLPNGETTLQYVLDHLLMNSESGKPEPLALNFLSCFANCDSHKVQNKFVLELKNALRRVLQQTESLFKHQHLRALLDLISSSIEAGSNQKGKSFLLKEYNLISYLMVKRGLALDLAKLTHSLDLSSPHLGQTLNSGLKALEILSKVAGYSLHFQQKEKKKEGTTVETPTETDHQTQTQVTEPETETIEDSFNEDGYDEQETYTTRDEPEQYDVTDDLQSSDNVINRMEQLENMINEEEQESYDINEIFDEAPESDNSDEEPSDDDDEDDDDDDEDGGDMSFSNSNGFYRGQDDFGGRLHIFGPPIHNDRLLSQREIDHLTHAPIRDEFFHMTIDEFMYPSNAMRRRSNAHWHRLMPSGSRLSRFAHNTNSTSIPIIMNNEISNSILQPLNTLHPLLNRSSNDERSRQNPTERQRDRQVASSGLDRIRFTAMNPPNLSVRNHLFRVPPFPPFGSPPRSLGDRQGGSRSSRQETALVFDDLVPDTMWSNIESDTNQKIDNLFPSAFFRWAEETAVLDGPSMHDLILLLKPHLLHFLKRNLEIEIEKRRIAREERKKKEAEKIKKPETDAQEKVNLIVDDTPTETSTTAVEQTSTPTTTPGNITPGTPTNTPNTTTGNTPNNTNTHTPATSEPNTSPVEPLIPPNHDDQLQAVSEELDQHQQEREQQVEPPELLSENMSVDGSNAPEDQTVSGLTEPDDVESAETTEPVSETPEIEQAPRVSPWNDIDPTFLAALPDDIRSEVIRERVNQATESALSISRESQLSAVPTEFLNALPENIRSEVEGAHVRAADDVRRRQRQLAAVESEPAGEDDPTGFIQSLDPRLRQQILSDLDSESINRLPTALATEALNLQQRRRTALEERQMRFLQQRNHRVSRRPNFTSGRPTMMRPNSRLVRDLQSKFGNKRSFPPLPAKYLIDSDSLSCLLVLLFVNDSNVQHQKLHRVLKNMFVHREGRKWITNTLLQIIQKTHESSLTTKESIHPQWLSLKLEASLGTRHGVFHLNNDQLNIHSQAASYVCRATLDSLIYLAKCFPRHFVSRGPSNEGKLSCFWDVLMRLENEKVEGVRKKKSESDLNLEVNSEEEKHITTLKQLDKTIFARLLRILKHPVIRDNRSLIDKMLNLLASVASNIPVLEDSNFESEILKDEVELVVEILTSHLCSDEGLEDCTEVLVALSMSHLSLRIQVLRHLLKGATKLGESLKCQISQLLNELRNRNTENTEDEKQSELQLPAMQLLTSKTSHQAFFLRILKVIVQLRKKEISLSKKRWCDQRSRSNYLDGWGRPRWELDSYRFDETLNNAIHAAITRNSPDAAETVIHVLEGMATANRHDTQRNRHDRESLLEYISSRGSRGTTQNDKEKKDQSEWKEQENKKKSEINELNMPLEQLLPCNDLWDALSNSLLELDLTRDNHAFLVLQPAVEAFFIVHASHLQSSTDKKDETKENQDPFSHINSIKPITSETSQEKKDEVEPLLPENEKKFVTFAEKHRAVLNQILRQSNVPLSDGPFAVLTKHIKILDFDVKRRFFRQELDKIKEKNSRGDMAINVSRNQIFDDSFRELHRKSAEEWKSRLYIVFDNEEGQDAGGLLREWFLVISRQMFNPNYALFQQSPTDKVTYRINPLSSINSNHKLYFNFVGRVVAKAIYDNKLLECYFTRAFYKHILGVMVTYKDMESEDYSLYQSLVYMLNNPVENLGYEITFSIDVEKFGVTKTVDLKENGRNVIVTDENKLEYVQLVCQEKLTESIKEQLRAFLEGFYDIIPNKLVSIFDEHELELLISGLPNIDIDDLKSNTEYHKYQPSSLQIQWFWRALKSFDQSERAKFLQFVTGTSKVPLQGFAHLEGMNGTQKFQIHRDDRETTRLPCAHTCFNQLDLPAYENYDFLRSQLLLAINEGSEGFGLA